MRKVRLHVPSPIKGLDGRIQDSLKSPQYASDMNNLRVQDGALQKDWGYVAYGTAASGVPLLIDVFKDYSGNEKLLLHTSTSLYQWVTNAWVSKSATTFSGTINDGWVGTLHREDYFSTNNKEEIQRKVLDTDFANMAGASAYRCQDIKSFRDHLVILNTTETTNYPHRVRWTKAGVLAFTTDDWDSVTHSDAGYYDILDTRGHIVISAILGSTLVIFKEDSIFHMDWVGGTETFRFDHHVAGLGALGKRCVVSRRGLLYFLGSDYNIYEYSGVSDVASIGDQISNELRALISTEYEKRTVVAYDADYDELLVNIPTGSNTYPSLLYRYSFTDQVWTKGTRAWTCAGWQRLNFDVTIGALPGTIGELIGTIGELSGKKLQKALMVGDSSGQIYYYTRNSSSLNGTAQTAYFDTIDFTLDHLQDNEKKKIGEYLQSICRFMGVYVEMYNSSLTMYYSIDGGRNWLAIQDSATLANSSTGVWQRVLGNCDITAQRIRFRFANTTSTDLKIRHFAVEALVAGTLTKDV